MHAKNHDVAPLALSLRPQQIYLPGHQAVGERFQPVGHENSEKSDEHKSDIHFLDAQDLPRVPEETAKTMFGGNHFDGHSNDESDSQSEAIPDEEMRQRRGEYHP